MNLRAETQPVLRTRLDQRLKKAEGTPPSVVPALLLTDSSLHLFGPGAGVRWSPHSS